MRTGRPEVWRHRGNCMNITDIKIRKLISTGRLRAIVSVTLNDEIAIHDIKVIEGPERLFVAMPSKREENGTFRDIVHPISSSASITLEQEVLNAYERELEREHAADSADGDETPGL